MKPAIHLIILFIFLFMVSPPHILIFSHSLPHLSVFPIPLSLFFSSRSLTLTLSPSLAPSLALRLFSHSHLSFSSQVLCCSHLSLYFICLLPISCILLLVELCINFTLHLSLSLSLHFFYHPRALTPSSSCYPSLCSCSLNSSLYACLSLCWLL